MRFTRCRLLVAAALVAALGIFAAAPVAADSNGPHVKSVAPSLEDLGFPAVIPNPSMLTACVLTQSFSQFFSVSSSVDHATQTLGHNATVTGTLHAVDASLPIDASTLTFRVTGANAGTATPATGLATIDANGNAPFSYTNTAVGTDTVQVFFDLNGNGVQDCGEPGSAQTVTWQTPVPTSLTLASNSQSALVNGTASVSATVTDQSGNPVADVPVHFEVTAGPNKGATFDATSGTDGVATGQYGSSKPGADTVHITAQSGALTTDSDLTVNWGYQLSIVGAGADQTIAAGEPSATVQAKVSDANGDPVEGILVRFEVTGGPHSGQTAENPSDADGLASLQLTRNDAANAGGVDRVSVSADTNASGALDAADQTVSATVNWEATTP